MLKWSFIKFFTASTFLIGVSSFANTEKPKDTVVVAMGNTSEPEGGFDPAFGWGAGEHVHAPLIQIGRAHV